jgi:hypothetical protein
MEVVLVVDNDTLLLPLVDGMYRKMGGRRADISGVGGGSGRVELSRWGNLIRLGGP